MRVREKHTDRAAGSPLLPRSALTRSPTCRYTSTRAVTAISRTCRIHTHLQILADSNINESNITNTPRPAHIPAFLVTFLLRVLLKYLIASSRLARELIIFLPFNFLDTSTGYKLVFLLLLILLSPSDLLPVRYSHGTKYS